MPTLVHTPVPTILASSCCSKTADLEGEAEASWTPGTVCICLLAMLGQLLVYALC